MKRKSALLAIAQLLAPSAKKRVALAFDDPGAYARKYRADIEARHGKKVDPWLALIDALADAGGLWSIDWKTPLDELKAVVDRLAGRKKSRWSWTRGMDPNERTTLEYLEMIGAHLRDEGLVLAQLAISGDEHNLVVVEAKDAARLVKLGGGQVERFTGSELKALERGRLARENKARAKEARSPDRQRQFIHPDGRVFIFWGKSWYAEGKRQRGYFTLKTRLGRDWTKVPSEFRKGPPPRVEKGFVEVSREEWLKRDELGG